MAPRPVIPGGTAQQKTYYEILQIAPSSLESLQDPSQTLKKAYHRALLIHHPDKRKQSGSGITVDQISLAYATLSSPSSRSAYDRVLLTSNPSLTSSPPLDHSHSFQTGIHEIDLDDLDYDPERAEWFRSCRCGNDRGYRFEEKDLEEAADFGEVMVGCQDCSLWLRVRFAVVDEDLDDPRQGTASGAGQGGGEGPGRDGDEIGGKDART